MDSLITTAVSSFVTHKTCSANFETHSSTNLGMKSEEEKETDEIKYSGGGSAHPVSAPHILPSWCTLSLSPTSPKHQPISAKLKEGGFHEALLACYPSNWALQMAKQSYPSETCSHLGRVSPISIFYRWEVLINKSAIWKTKWSRVGRQADLLF